MASRRSAKSVPESSRPSFSSSGNGNSGSSITSKRPGRIGHKATSKFGVFLVLLMMVIVMLFSNASSGEDDNNNHNSSIQVEDLSFAPPRKESKTTATAATRGAAKKNQGGGGSNGIMPTSFPNGKPLHEYTLITEAELIPSAPNTVVTGYFTLKSKFAKESYLGWMSNMLSLQDPMIIFTSPELVPTMQQFRAHAQNRTVIIPMNLSQVELVHSLYPDEQFWQDQLDKDPEKRIHRSYQLFWIWLSKSFLVVEAIKLNLFHSDVFMWSDIGCFRNARYRDQEMIQQRHRIPRRRVFQMAHHTPNPPPYIWWNDKYTQKAYFYHSGSQMVAYHDTWLDFHREFLATIRGFVDRKMFLGEDQTVLQSTCLRVPSLCAYIPFDQIGDNHYFGLRYVLRYPQPDNKYQYWYPPQNLPAEKTDVDPKLLERTKDPPKPGKETFQMA